MSIFEDIHGEHGRSFGLRYYIVSLLAKKEMTGAMIIDEISRITLGYLKPSPGSIYPMLSILANSGYLKSRTQKGRKFYTLTSKARDRFSEMSVPPMAFLNRSSRNDSIEESIASIQYSIDYLLDNIDSLRKDRKSYQELLKITKQMQRML